MPTLYMTKGLPGSGKSSRALDMMQSSTRLKRVNKDLLREMIHGGKWSRAREKVIVQARNDLINLFLDDGYDVISDDTNFGPHEAQLRELAKQQGAQFQVIDLTDVPYETCVKNDLDRPKSVGEQVIKRMWLQHLCPPLAEPDPNLDYCVIVDLDGTLADISHRSPYDASTCEQDGVRLHVQATVEGLRHRTPNGQIAPVFAFSGRMSTYMAETWNWLHTHGITVDGLFMRQEGDTRKDAVIKRELYETNIKGRYNVYAVVDDRPQVLRNWRELGLNTIDVSERMGLEF